jgi:hypothetical protein
MNVMPPPHVEQKQLELAAKAAGIKYLMYVPYSHPHPSGLLYRRDSASRLAVWNPLRDDGDLFRLGLAVPDVDLHQIIVEARAAGPDDLARRVRETFVRAVIERVEAEETRLSQERTQTLTELDDAPVMDAQQDQGVSET